MTELMTLIILALLASPWLIQFVLVRRKRQILEQECRMSEAMAEMEELMLEAGRRGSSRRRVPDHACHTEPSQIRHWTQEAVY